MIFVPRSFEMTSNDITKSTHLIYFPLTLKSLHRSDYIATHKRDLSAWILAVMLKNRCRRPCELRVWYHWGM